jgi:hypothetical protein
MDVSSYNKYFSTGLSLLNYLNGGTANTYGGISQSVMSAINSRYQNAQAGAANAAAGDVVQLSPEAQALLKTTGGDDQDTKLSGVQKAAQNFLVSFFDQGDADLKKLSPEALTMIEGLQDVIAGNPATGRDVTTDRMEMSNAKGSRKVYTLTGNNSRLRLAIQYGEDKKTPVKLTMTDISGGKVETADITLTKDSKGVLQMSIERAQMAYRNGNKVSENKLAPISVKLYK